MSWLKSRYVTGKWRAAWPWCGPESLSLYLLGPSGAGSKREAINWRTLAQRVRDTLCHYNPKIFLAGEGGGGREECPRDWLTDRRAVLIMILARSAGSAGEPLHGPGPPGS